MSEPFFERLTALDASFLGIEADDTHMHVASVSTLDARPLTRHDGGLDVERIHTAMHQMLARNPRMRQKVWWPVGGPPVWIDDADFRLSYHVRHTALPLPGTMRQLKRLAGRVMSQTLDPRKPLWEIWLIEGLENERFAIMAKLHHCLADGIGARDILTGYLGTAPIEKVDPVPPWRARPAPTLAQIALAGVRQRGQKTRELVGQAREILGVNDLRASLTDAAAGVLSAASNAVGAVAPTPFNRAIGPHRRFDCTACGFDRVLAVRKAAGGKVNDVVLATVAAATRRFLLGRKLDVDSMDFRVMVPVNVRGDGPAGGGGNHVSNMTIPLPLYETDPRRRLMRIIETTARAKASRQSRAGELLAAAADWAGIIPPRGLAQRAAHQITANMVVTNVPGPLFPMFLLESRLLESFPLVPLAPEQALGIALYTYDKSLHWGFNADWDVLPDVHDFARAVDVEFEQLVRAWEPIEVLTRTAASDVAPPPAAQTTDATAGAERGETAQEGRTAEPVDRAAAQESSARASEAETTRGQRQPRRPRRKPDASVADA